MECNSFCNSGGPLWECGQASRLRRALLDAAGRAAALGQGACSRYDYFAGY